MLQSRFCWCVLGPFLGVARALRMLSGAPETASAAVEAEKGPISFINDVAPILRENCFACHDSKKRKGKLDMSTYEGLRKGGHKDDPIVPDSPEDSLILDMLKSTGA